MKCFCKATPDDKPDELKIDEELKMTNTISRDGVLKLFNASVPRSKYEIVEIEALQRNAAYEAIIDKKCQQGMKRGDIEKYLWHGSKIDAIRSILKNGFDRSFSARKSFGKGTYFAKDALLSISYCAHDDFGRYHILLCKVLTGSYTKGCSDLKRIPKKSDGTEYDCMVNRQKNPSVFVVWRDHHAVPCYLVKFIAK